MNYSIEQQLNNYKKGFPFIKVLAPATPERGILVLSESEQEESLERYNDFSGKLVKFVPASGAASRMFKDLFDAREKLERGESIQDSSPAGKFFQNLEKFPFYNDDFKGLMPLQVLNKVLGTDGLDYGSKPKGQILFHKYSGDTNCRVSGHSIAIPKEVRTAFEEHFLEGALYAKTKGNAVHLHFTVSAEHQKDFEALVKELQPKYEKRFSCRFIISFSNQSPDTDMIAVNEDNTPFLKADGKPLFRPGGHGALLKNLGRVDGDIIFVKNIDNIIRQELVVDTVRWKKILAGKLIEVREKVFEYLHKLDTISFDACESEEPLRCTLAEISAFLRFTFQIKVPMLSNEQMIDYLREKLNRPIRVCGMVKNEGEPGGGPFIVSDNDGSTSLQILEGAQLDMNDINIQALVAQSTHFNPVDLVCSTVNYKGEKFDLSKFIDIQAGFISSKSYEGRKLKAQELPGLWNGSMSKWNTIFVETPLITFNPVKTVLDLLRKEHLG